MSSATRPNCVLTAAADGSLYGHSQCVADAAVARPCGPPTGTGVWCASTMGSDFQPLSERVLARLPGRRWLSVVAWALVPWFNAGVNLLLGTESKSAIWEQSAALVVLNYASLSFAIVLALWGSRTIADRLEGLGKQDQFRELNTVAAPLLGAAVTAIAFAGTALAEDGATAAVLRGLTWLVVGSALWSFLWTYLSLQIGLHRIGRDHAAPDAARGDPLLGQRPYGDLAFTGLWILLAMLVPLVSTGLPDVVGFVIGTIVLAGGLAAFFLSLVRLHHRMVAVKNEELALARDLYAQAYAPVRAHPSLETLEQQRSLLAAADALEQRARAIHDWPIDEGTFARVLTIATSVVAITIGRLILDPFGL